MTYLFTPAPLSLFVYMRTGDIDLFASTCIFELHMSYVDSILSVPNTQWFPPAHCLGACGGVEKFMRKAATSVEGGQA